MPIMHCHAYLAGARVRARGDEGLHTLEFGSKSLSIISLESTFELR